MKHELVPEVLFSKVGTTLLRDGGWEILKKSGCYLVGGTVRDILLQKQPKDVDIVCRNAKQVALDIAERTDAAFVPLEKKPDEPCYRVVDRKDISSFIDIAELRGETIFDDLAKRDFTINSAAIEILKDGSFGALTDPFKGWDDLITKVVRMTNAGSFPDDPLRILRAFRFSAEFGFNIESATLEKLRRCAPLLAHVSTERIMAEVYLLLKTSTSSSFFRQMDSFGVTEIILPEIMPVKGCLQNGFHHLDVWEHSLVVMKNCENILSSFTEYFGKYSGNVQKIIDTGNRRPLLKLAALLHDIGKPATKGVNPDTGRITFYNHDMEGAKLISCMSERLRISGADRDFLVAMVAGHMRALNLTSLKIKTPARIKWFREMQDNSIPAIILAMADIMSSLGPESTEEYRKRHIEGLKKNIFDYFDWIKTRITASPLITGDDLIELGMKQGPEIGELIHKIREALDNSEISTREEALDMAKRLLRYK